MQPPGGGGARKLASALWGGLGRRRRWRAAGDERNVIYRIDPAEERVTAAFKIPVPCAPHGIAINPATHQGIIGCGLRPAPAVIGWDFREGRALTIFNQTGAGDVAIYDPKADRFSYAAVNLPDPAVAVFSGSPLAFLGSIATGPRAKSIGEPHGQVGLRSRTRL